MTQENPENIIYKFIELSVVTDESLEEVVNKWTTEGWQLDAIRFAMLEGSRLSLIHI